MPNIFYGHNLADVLELFRKEFLEVKSGQNLRITALLAAILEII